MVRSFIVLMEIVSIIYGLTTFFGRKVKLDIATVSFTISEIFLTALINEYDYPVYWLSLSYIIIFVYGLIEYHDTMKRTLLNCLLTIGILAVLQQLFSLVFLKIFETDYALFGAFLVNVCCIIVLILLKPSGRLQSLSDFLFKSKKVYYAILAFVLVCIGGNIVNAKVNGAFNEENYVQVIYFSVLLVSIILEWQKARREYEKEIAKRELNKLYFSAYEELIELVRDKQHDMKNHINAIYSMIYTIDNYDKLVERQKKYCQIVLDSCSETNILISVKNPLIAGFIYKRMQDAKCKGIEVLCKINEMKEELSIPEYEIIDMLGVLLDNAIEALAEESSATKKIIIEYSYDSEWESLTIANSSREYSEQEISQFFIRGYSSKDKNRGIGLDKVRRKLKEMGGGINVVNRIVEEENFLRFTIMFPMKKETE